MSSGTTRREFLKTAATQSVAIGFSSNFLANAGIVDTYTCKKCKSVNTNIPLTYFRIIYPTPQYCHNCGVNSFTLNHDISCSSFCAINDENFSSWNKCGFLCCQIPFPNHRYLDKSRKPNFSLSELQF